MIATCSGCTSTWSGLRVAHCGRCHATFTTVGNFDRHLVTDVYGDRACLRPIDVGLVINDLDRWHRPGPIEARATVRVGPRIEDLFPTCLDITEAPW